MADRPPRIQKTPQVWQQGVGMDPARYLVDPGAVLAPGRHSPGQLYHARPYLASDNEIFVFPVGVEGFTRSGQAQLGLHHYIGDNSVDGITVHYEEARIELSGTLPGTTAQNKMVACLALLRSQPQNGILLYAPGIFEREQYVLPENWNFTHAADDRSHSIDYTITLVRIGEGRKVKDPHGKPAPPTPSIKTKPRGKPAKIFTVNEKHRTLRSIAKKVYGDANKWNRLVRMNAGQLALWRRSNAIGAQYHLPTYKLPTFRWPIGTKFRY